MTAAFTRFREHLSHWREWELNPIVVKELRQAVRSWSVTGMLLLFLGVLFCTALAFLIGQSFEVAVDNRLGAQVFQVFVGILTGASLFFIPLYVGIRLAAERQESNLDLLYITTLTPGRIIRGKFLCGAYMTVLFFSACMPFMAFTNLLRGVDLPTVAFILLCLFLAVCVAIQVAIFIACLPLGRLLKILLGLLGVVWMMPATGMLTFGFVSMMRSGIGSMMNSGAFWVTSFTIVGLVSGGVVLLYLASVALISPPSANRALPLRAYITGFWMLTGIASVIWAVQTGTASKILPWAGWTIAFMAVAVLNVISNHDQLSLRVRRDIPASIRGRLLAFPFFNGAAGGLIWAAGISFLTIMTIMAARVWLPTSHDYSNSVEVIMATALYLFAYGLTALFLHRRFVSRRPPKLAGILGILIPGVWALLPNAGLFFTGRLSSGSFNATQLGNVFNVFSVDTSGQRAAHILCAGAWLLGTIFLNWRWFRRQVREFQPLIRHLNPEPASVPVPPRIPEEPGVLQR